VAHLVSSSTALAFLTNVRQIRKATSPSEFQVKNRQKTISTEEQLDVISLLEKGAQIGDVSCNIRFTHSSVCTMRDNTDRITEWAKSGPKEFV